MVSRLLKFFIGREISALGTQLRAQHTSTSWLVADQNAFVEGVSCEDRGSAYLDALSRRSSSMYITGN